MNKGGGKEDRFFYGWVVVAIAFVTMGLGYSLWYSFTVFFLAVLDEFHWSRADGALAFSLFVTVHGLSGPLVGVLVDRFSTRLVMPLGTVVLAGTLVAASQAREGWQFYLAFGVLAATAINAIGSVANYAVLNRWFVKRRALAVGMGSSGIGALGIFAMVPFTQYLISAYGWRNAYLIVAALLLAIIPPVTFFFQRDRPEDKGQRPDGLRELPAAMQTRRSVPDAGVIDRRWAGTNWTLKRAARTWHFWGLFITFAIAPVANQTIFVHQTAYFVGQGYSPMLAATIVGLVGLVATPGKIVSGWLSDLLGRELAYTLGVSLMIVALALLLALPLLGGVWPLVAFAVCYGLGYSVHSAMTPSVTADFFAGRSFAVIYGVLLIGNQAGAGAGAWVGGFIYDVTGAYTLAFIISGVFAILAVVGLWIVGPRRVRLASGPAARAAR